MSITVGELCGLTKESSRAGWVAGTAAGMGLSSAALGGMAGMPIGALVGALRKAKNREERLKHVRSGLLTGGGIGAGIGAVGGASLGALYGNEVQDSIDWSKLHPPEVDKNGWTTVKYPSGGGLLIPPGGDRSKALMLDWH